MTNLHDHSRGSLDTVDFTKTCIHCSTVHRFTVSLDDYNKIFHERKFMQDVFPYLNHTERELMISGTCAPCWDEMFADEED